jgi:hypothetical protein
MACRYFPVCQKNYICIDWRTIEYVKRVSIPTRRKWNPWKTNKEWVRAELGAGRDQKA